MTRRAVEVGNATVLIKGEEKKWFLSAKPEERKLGRGLALSKRKAFPTSRVVLLLDHVACEVGVPEGDALPDLDLGGESVKERTASAFGGPSALGGARGRRTRLTSVLVSGLIFSSCTKVPLVDLRSVT